MKLLIKIGWKIIISLTLVACGQSRPKEEDKGYFEDLGILKEPVEFAKELSLPHDTWKGSISDDGRKFYFFRHLAKNEEDYRIYESEFKKGKWSEPKEIEFSDGSSDLYPVINSNGKSMLFVSYREIDKAAENKTNANFWKSENKNNKWSKPIFVEGLSIRENYDSQPTMTSDGDLYYTTNTDTPKNWETITMFSLKEQNGYATPKRFSPVNLWREELTDLTIYEICMSPSENYLIATISKKDEKADLYISKKENEKWSEPKRLDNRINTNGTENFPYISSDGKYLFFTREFSEFYHISTSVILKSNDDN